MGFKNIKSKGADMGKKPMSTFLKVNKYENPQAVLDLISHIYTKGVNLSVTDCFAPYRDMYNELKGFQNTFDDDYPLVENSLDKLTENCDFTYSWTPRYIEQPFMDSCAMIAVGGGYSSGKSSFLNSVTGMSDVLPTGIEPVSMVNTFIAFSANAKKPEVLGRNLKRDIVKLNRQVLDCIQHSSKSKVYVSSVLEELYVSIPPSEDKSYLKDMVFVDTPGYNNSDNANAENGKRDMDTALEAVRLADGIFWCIDAEAGTISQRDIEMLNDALDINEGKAFPYVIVFNKMDKKPEEDMVDILKGTRKICKAKLKRQPVDIIAYSSLPDHPAIISLQTRKKAYDSDGVTKILSALFSQLHKHVNFVPAFDLWNNALAGYFDEEILTCDNAISDLEKERKELAKKKGELFRSSNRESDDTLCSFLPNIKGMLIDSYDEILENRDSLSDFLDAAMEGWYNSLHRESALHGKVGFFSDASKEERQHGNAIGLYDKLADKAKKKANAFEYWSKESRENCYKVIEGACELADEYSESHEDIENLESEYKNLVESMRILRNYKAYLQKKKKEVVDVFAACYTTAKELTSKRLCALQTIKEEDESDIFSAIANDNMPRFLDCFSEGVDLTICNSQGFSPLTYAAKNSNNAMIKFLVQHQADLSQKDKNGYNALETAAIYHCQDICELLLKAEPNLIYESRPLVDLASNDKFEKWLTSMQRL